MANLYLVLLVLAFALFDIAAGFPPPAPADPHRLRIVAAGLACWVASLIF